MNSFSLDILIVKLVGTVLLGTLLLLVPINNIQFILFGLLPMGIFGFLARQKKLSLQLRNFDLGLLGFVVVCFLSYLWAVNGSLIWSQAFGWLGLLATMWAFRELNSGFKIQSYLQHVFILFFLVVMIHHLTAVRFDVEVVSADWNAFMAKNGNQTACYLLALFPFLAYYKSRNPLVSFLKLTAVILLVNLIILVNAKGALVAIGACLALYLWLENRQKASSLILALLSLGVIVYVLKIFNPALFGFLPTPLDEPRSTLVGYSVDLFKSNPLLGVGLGNWHTQAYSADLSQMPSFNNPLKFERHNSYNLFFQILSELGILGSVFFGTFITLFFREVHKVKNTMTDFEKAAAAAIVIYFVCSYFYKGVNFNDFSFSGAELLAFISFGIISSRFRKLDLRMPSWILYILPLLVICWFSYSMMSWHAYQNYKMTKSSSSITEKIGALESLYHPIFKTKHGYRRSLDLELAELHVEAGATTKADYYYGLVLEKESHNCQALLSYADYLIKSKEQDSNKINALIKRVEAIQSNNAQLLKMKASFNE